MTEEDTGSAAKSKVVLPGQTGDAMSAPEGANASSVAAHNNKVPKAGAESQEELAKEVTWHDQHGMDLTQVREFEPRCAAPVRRPLPPPNAKIQHAKRAKGGETWGVHTPPTLSPFFLWVWVGGLNGEL